MNNLIIQVYIKESSILILKNIHPAIIKHNKNI